MLRFEQLWTRSKLNRKVSDSRHQYHHHHRRRRHRVQHDRLLVLFHLLPIFNLSKG